MSCLLPQFKCSPDTFAVNFKSCSHFYLTSSSKAREAIIFRTQCILATTSPKPLTATTTVLEIEKLELSLETIPKSDTTDRSWKTPTSISENAMLDLEKLSSLDARPIPFSANKPWTYVETPPKIDHGATLDKQALLTSEEAVIVAAAASEALALAKTAVKVAKDAAMMVNHHKSTKSDTNITAGILPDAYNERIFIRESKVAGTGLGDNYPASYPISYSDEVEPSADELQFLEEQLSSSIAVRSNRQTERKARRSRAAEKAASSIVSVKSGSSSKKKRSSVQDVDYNDPLRYLRGTTSSSRLLTASEEQMLSGGIQISGVQYNDDGYYLYGELLEHDAAMIKVPRFDCRARCSVIVFTSDQPVLKCDDNHIL